jgi:DNA-damage-inducible protein J
MTENTVVRARINEHIKEEAATVLAAIGLTVSDAFRILLTRVAKDKVFPFEPLMPNKTTIAAMKNAREGKLITVGKVNNLLDSLNEDD